MSNDECRMGGVRRALIYSPGNAAGACAAGGFGRPSTEGQVEHKILQLGRLGALRGQGQFLNRLSNRQSVRHGDDSRHDLAGFHAVVSVLGNRLQVVRHEDAAVFCRPGEYGGIEAALQCDVLRDDVIEMGNGTSQAPQDSLVEVLVNEQGEHGLIAGRSLHRVGPALAQPFPQAARVLLALNFPAGLRGGLFLCPEIFLHGLSVLEVVGNGTVDVPQLKRREVFLDLFGGRPALELVNDGIEGDPRAGDADGSVLGARERRPLGWFQFWHGKRNVRRARPADNEENVPRQTDERSDPRSVNDSAGDGL